jgi:NDP-sugar pyrophosphorylase family protein
MKSFIEMNNQIIIIIGILSVALLLPSMPTEFHVLATPNPFGQQVMVGSIADDYSSSASHTINNRMSENNIVAISTTTGTIGAMSTSSGNTNQTTPMISVVDVINSTYIVPTETDEDDSERRISRAIRDRINDISHTVVMSNATIISTATITNSFVDESTTINNYTRLLEIIPDQVEVALAGIRAASQTANPMIEIHTDIETVCGANNTTLAECNIKIRIR